MPELPEAETIVRGLAARLPGRRIADVTVTHADVLAPDLTPGALRGALAGHAVAEVHRRGKNVVFRFDDDTRLVVNLGMTGRLLLSGAPRATELAHVAVRLRLEDGEALLFDDTRRFGRLELHGPAGWREKDERLGAEPLDPAFTGALLHRLAQRSRTPIRNWLLDQRRVAGVGNIYANEALFRARIHPARPAATLSPRKARALRDALRDVLRESIEARGTTLSDFRFRDDRGEEGDFGRWLRVYGRAGEPCPTCGRAIERGVLSNRSYFFCPHCQR